MDKTRAHSLRKKLDTRLIALIKPKDMSIDEYRIACNLDEFDASVENGSFLHWIMTAEDGEETDVADKVHAAIVNALEKKYLLDESSAEQCSYFCDAVRDVLLKDKDYAIQLLEAVLKNYKSSGGHALEVFDFCKQLNKAFGLTTVEYFDYGGLKSSLLSMRKSKNAVSKC